MTPGKKPGRGVEARADQLPLEGQRGRLRRRDSASRVVITSTERLVHVAVARSRAWVADPRWSPVGHDPGLALRLLYLIFWQALGRALSW